MSRRGRPLGRTASLAVLSCLVGALLVIPGAASAGHRFTDVSDGHNFHAAIGWLAEYDITKGCNPPTNDQFCPDDLVTRGQMAAFLVRAMGYTDDGGGDLFTDDDGHTFEGAIDKLATAGVTKGCNPPTNDQFCPDDLVTRGQMAAFLVRAMGYTDDGGGDLFTDDDGHIFEGAIDKLATAGVTKGCNPPTNDQFCPDDLVTRAQMAGFLYRAAGPPALCTEAPVPMVECLALTTLYLTTSGEGWTNNDNWLNDPDVCAWYGVTCSQGHIAEILLIHNDLTGPLPPEIGNLTHLTRLRFDANQLTGPIPSEVGSLNRLDWLGLSNNVLSGSLPPEIGNLTTLRTLDLERNLLTGSIPPELGNLTNLSWLHLGDNQFTGSIPFEFFNLTNLNSITLSGNELTGSIPPEIGNLTNVWRLDLDGNRFTGSIPSEMGNLSALQALLLSNNDLHGEVPEELRDTALDCIDYWCLDPARLSLRGQTGCLFTNDLSFEAWLDERDHLWDDGCP